MAEEGLAILAPQKLNRQPFGVALSFTKAKNHSYFPIGIQTDEESVLLLFPYVDAAISFLYSYQLFLSHDV